MLIIVLLFLLPYTSTSLVILLFAFLFSQKQATHRYTIGFIVVFYFINSFLLRLIFSFGIVLSLIHNVFIISIAYLMITQFRIYGLTGQICSGKTYVSNYFKTQYGASIISLDQINKQVLELPKVKHAVRRLFGDEVFIQNPDDPSIEELDKLKIRRLIFENPEKRRRLERITYPKVFIIFAKKLFLEKFLRHGQLVFIENALLLRFAVLRLLCYKIISICVEDRNTTIERVMIRDNCDRALAENIIKTQMTTEQFRRGSDVVIINDGSEAQLNEKLDNLFMQIVHNSFT